MKYLVTTSRDRIPADHQILMLDGTVPGWVPFPDDYHADHHRRGGAQVQIDEMALGANEDWILTEGIANGKPQCIVTTQVDADACVSAAAAQLPAWILFDVINQCPSQIYQRLKAIAHECDHLCLPSELAHLEDFAAQAVATLKSEGFKLAKVLSLPDDRREWMEQQREQYSSAAFESGTKWLIAASKGERPWPGEQGEAKEYWDGVKSDSAMLSSSGSVTFYKGVAICNTRGINRYVDPRSFLQLIVASFPDIGRLSPITLTVRDHKTGWTCFTLGCIPTHPDVVLGKLDYTTGTFQRLTMIEAQKRGNSSSQINAITTLWDKPELPEILGFDPWGGRATVGGSGWRTPSVLRPEEVIDVVLDSMIA